jgi:hypothetical protein
MVSLGLLKVDLDPTNILNTVLDSLSFGQVSKQASFITKPNI